MAATDWTTLSPELVTGRMTTYELDLYRTKFLDPADDPDADGDPLPEIIEGVISEVRSFVESCQRNTLAASPQIPRACVRSAVNTVIYQLLSRIPRIEISEARTQLYTDAKEFLKGVAKCQPIMPTGSDSTGGSGSGNPSKSGIQKSSALGVVNMLPPI